MEILATTGISNEIEKVIEESNQSLIIVSPYLKIHTRLKPKLASCTKRGVKCLVIYRAGDIQPEELYYFKSNPEIKIIPIKNLHAKCYLNEFECILSSMNLYDYSQINNHEIGVVINREGDEKSYDIVCGIISSIVETDFPDFNIDSYITPIKQLTMGDIYSDLASKYFFPGRYNKLDGTYMMMSDIACSLHKFSNEDMKGNEDDRILKRSTKLDFRLYNKIREAIIKVGVLKEK